MATYAADSNHHGAALVAVIRGQVGALATSSAYSYCLRKRWFLERNSTNLAIDS
jgi:hypothetical protein